MQKLSTTIINVSNDVQSRKSIHESIIQEYTQSMSDGDEFPPVIVFFDGSNYWLSDGFHRYHAAVRAGFVEIACEIKEGNKRDAILYSVGANGKHGLRRTNADKRKAALMLLMDEEWGKWSSNKIAKQCGVSDMTIGRIREELSLQQSGSEEKTSRTYTDKHGNITTMNTSNIGKTKPDNLLPKGEQMAGNVEVLDYEIVNENDIPAERDYKKFVKIGEELITTLNTDNIKSIALIDRVFMKEQLIFLRNRIDEVLKVIE